MSIRAIAPSDICRWPDYTWCFYDDLPQYNWKSDDYEVIPYGTDTWFQLAEKDCGFNS